MTENELYDLLENANISTMCSMLIQNIEALEAGTLEDPEEGESVVENFLQDLRILRDQIDCLLNYNGRT